MSAKRGIETITNETKKRAKAGPECANSSGEASTSKVKVKKYTPNIQSSAEPLVLSRDQIGIYAINAAPVGYELNGEAMKLIPERSGFANHNKSDDSSLSILGFSDEVLEPIYQGMRTEGISGQLSDRIAILMGTRCLKAGGEKGRHTVASKEDPQRTVDIFYYYQLVAWKKYGRWALSLVAPSKRWCDLTISHLCGTRQCCRPSHMVLEPKWLNDIRTHHHETLKGVLGNAELSDNDAINRVRSIITGGGCRFCWEPCFHEDSSHHGIAFSSNSGDKKPDDKDLRAVPLYICK